MFSPVYPRKPRPRRNRRRAGAAASPPPPPPPPVEVMVTAVKTVPGNAYQADFFFSAPVTVIADYSTDLWLEFPIFGNEYPLISEQLSPEVVRFTFGDDSVAAGIPWHVESPPSNLDLNGATMPVPQDGLVED